MTNGTLILVVGLPGSGKTTRAKQLEKERNGVRFCPDEWMDALEINLWDSQARERIEKLQWALAQRILETGGCAIIEWGTWGKAEREVLRKRARSLNAAAELHFLDVDVDELWKRIQLRGAENPPIQKKDLEHWAELIQEPDKQEQAMYDNHEQPGQMQENPEKT